MLRVLTKRSFFNFFYYFGKEEIRFIGNENDFSLPLKVVDWSIQNASSSYDRSSVVEELISGCLPLIASEFQDISTHQDEIKVLDELLLLDSSQSDLLLERKNHEAKISSCTQEILRLILQNVQSKVEEDPDEAVLEFRSGVGGEESCLFTKELSDMYLEFGRANNWRHEVIQAETSNLDGYRFLRVLLKGDKCHQILKNDGGVVRIQRIPVTDNKSRLQTSSASLTVLSNSHQKTFQAHQNLGLDPADLKFEFKRASGPGGQSVNKSNSACRVTHLPTKISVNMMAMNNTTDNRNAAILMLKKKLISLQQNITQQHINNIKSAQVTTVNRSDKFRTFNFDNDLVTDHRSNIQVHGAREMLRTGDGLGDIIEHANDFFEQSDLRNISKRLIEEYERHHSS